MKILFLVARYYHEHKMSRGRFLRLAAVGRARDVELRLWGKGWPRYDQLRTVAENLTSIQWRPDLVHLYKPEDHLGVAELDVPKSVDYQEAWWPDGRATTECRDAGVSLVIHHHANDADRFASLDEVKVVHLPHCAERDVFWPDEEQEQERRIDYLMTGVNSKEIYPLRHRLTGMIEDGRLSGIVRKHPGYRLPSVEECDSQVRTYAAQLRQAKIVLCCTSQHKYALAKIVEAMMAGCLVATDMPNDKWFQETLGRYIIRLSTDWSDDRIIDAIRWWLDMPVLSKKRARGGQLLALKQFSTERWAGRFLKVASEVVGGKPKVRVRQSASYDEE